MEFVASLGNFSWLSSDCVSFSLLLLNLIITFHNQSKNRRQNSSYEKHNTYKLIYFSILPVVLQCFSHQWLWHKLYKAILFQFLDCFSLVFFEKDSPLHPRLNKFPGWIDCKATYKAKGAASTLKRLETWRETNAPVWLLIGRIIFPTNENTIIHNYSDWTYHLFHVCKTFLAPQIGSNSYQYASI